MGRTIKVSEESYKWLLSLAMAISKENNRRVSFDEVLKELRDSGDEGDIMELAGKWEDISDKDSKNIKEEIKKRWKN
ncbi:MAG: hypothetical protein ABEI74_04405 [Candidatus Pacearchaeota archaeon]